MNSVATDNALGHEVSKEGASVGSPRVFKDQDQRSCGDSPSQQGVKVCQACADEGLAVESRSCAETCDRCKISA